MTLRIATLLAPVLVLAACAETEDASLVPVNQDGFQAAEQVQAPETEQVELAIGEWRQSLQDEEQALEFGPAGTEPLFSMRCGESGGLMLQRHGAVAVGGPEMMTVTLGGETRQFAVVAGEGPLPMLRASVPSNEPLIGALVDVNEPLTIRMGDAAPLALPPSPMIGEFVTQCAGQAQQRRGEALAQ